MSGTQVLKWHPDYALIQEVMPHATLQSFTPRLLALRKVGGSAKLPERLSTPPRLNVEDAVNRTHPCTFHLEHAADGLMRNYRVLA
jgi:hypothetical protein